MDRVLVALSGGVDSAYTAWRLKEMGYKVEGVCLNLFAGSLSPSQAQEVGARLDIPVHILDARQRFCDIVIDEFSRTYALGKTPNPCVICNPQVKFHLLLAYADERRIHQVATGHYARCDKCPKTGGHRLLRGLDSGKDQSYFLHRLNQEQLKRIFFPLGEMAKAEVRNQAAAAGLAVAQKKDSQEICFIPNGDYVTFLRRQMTEEQADQEPVVPPVPWASGFTPGNFVDVNGNVLGRHRGLAHYTVGQRKHLGLAMGKPVFVLALEVQSNCVVIGEGENLYQSQVMTEENMFINGVLPENPLAVQVKLRSGAIPAPAIYYPGDHGRARLDFAQPQRGPTPGQSAVYYQGDEVLGGGRISLQ